jgi:hypothetical protein
MYNRNTVTLGACQCTRMIFQTVQSKEVPIRCNLCRKHTDLWSEYFPPQEGPMDNIQLLC